MWGGVAFRVPDAVQRTSTAEPVLGPRGARTRVRPYSTLPIFFTAAIRRALSSVTNFENSGASR
jgi:hypothetical protein